MYLTYLQLDNFRNYQKLTLELPQGPVLLCGDNAQGKTNLLEAIYFLATTRSSFARAERQVINWYSLESDPMPYARIEGHVQRSGGQVRVDVTVLPNESGQVRKEMRINGVKKRALDVIGQLNAVLFLPEDIDLVTGSPSSRRRYLDITLCQIDPAYCRTLSLYNQTITQRNALLKRLNERRGDADELLFWDERVAEYGAALLVTRRDTVAELDRLARSRYRQLTDEAETLRLYYAPSFDPDQRPLLDYQRPLSLEDMWNGGPPPLSRAEVGAAFAAELKRVRREEIARGVTVVGPHRDDMHFLVDGIDMNLYGSRGQQRTTALTLKLAEVDLMNRVTGEAPVLLLDDVMSELDARRRARVIAMVDGVQQALLTATDWSDFTEDFRARAQLWTVTAGVVQRP
jgi:DNA replication and repair protein RecF